MRVGRLCGCEQALEGLEHLAGDLANGAVAGRARRIGWVLDGCVHIGRVSTRLNEHDLDTKLRDFVAEAFGQCLHGELAGAIDAEERKGHSAEDRADIDDQSVALRPHRWQRRAAGAQ